MASAALTLTQTLVAATATNDTITGQHAYIEITNQTSGTVVYVNIGATVPTVAGDNSFAVLGLATKKFPKQGIGKTGGTQVQMISAGTPVVTIAGVNL